MWMYDGDLWVSRGQGTKGGDVERVAKVMYKLLVFLKATSFDFEMLELCDEFFLECLENFENRDSDQS